MRTFKQYILARENANTPDVEAKWYVARWEDGAIVAGPLTRTDALREAERATRNSHHGERYGVIGKEGQPMDSQGNVLQKSLYPDGANTVGWRNPDATHSRPWRLTNPQTGDFKSMA